MEFRENVELAPYTTLRVGGPARWFAEAVTPGDIQEALSFASEHTLPLFILGGGSNLLVSDAGFPGLVLRIASRGIGREGDTLHAAAGENWDAVVSASVDAGLAGIECLSGIPGTNGATPIQNVGAYGQEVSSTILEVQAIDASSQEAITISGSDCDFGYRQSRFNRRDAGKFIITGVSYKLSQAGAPQLAYPELQQALQEIDKPTLLQAREAVLQLRQRKGMLLLGGDPDCRSAGSFFRNPIVTAELADLIASQTDVAMPRYTSPTGDVKISAAWLIERAGLNRGFEMGHAAISSKHTLALINRGPATSAEIVALREFVVATVRDKFAIELQQEPVNVA